MKHFYQKVDDPVTAYGKYISTLGLTKSVLLTSVFFGCGPRAYRHSVLRQKKPLSVKLIFPAPGGNIQSHSIFSGINYSELVQPISFLKSSPNPVSNELNNSVVCIHQYSVCPVSGQGARLLNYKAACLRSGCQRRAGKKCRLNDKIWVRLGSEANFRSHKIQNSR